MQTARANTAVSPHMSNPTAERRDIAKQVLDQLRKVTERRTADIIAGDFNKADKCEDENRRSSERERDLADSSAGGSERFSATFTHVGKQDSQLQKKLTNSCE